MSRISTTFTRLKAANQAAFIPFIMAGDPDAETSLQVLHGLVEAGADIIEIGMPFSDPMADGPVIEQAGNRALKAGMTLKGVFALVSQFRKTNNTTPIILMGYCNPAYAMGWQNFSANAATAGADGLIMVDLPPEEEGELTPHLTKNNIDLIRLIAPTTTQQRRKRIYKTASGFLYYVSVAGITGDKSADFGNLASAISQIRSETDLPIAIGFGIKTPEQVAEITQIADGAVVGSALVKSLCTQGKAEMLKLATHLAAATK